MDTLKPGIEEEQIDISQEEERYYVASQWQLMWWKFRKHRMAIIGGIVLILFYLLAGFCEFFSPYDPHHSFKKYLNAPVQRPRFRDSEGFHLRPFVYALKGKRDERTRRIHYSIDEYE